MERLDRFAPPGMDTSRQRWAVVSVIVISLFFSISFLVEYAEKLRELRANMEDPVYAGMTMTPFRDLIVFPMLMFRMAPVVPLLNIPGNYLYFYQETKSIYVMKRLRSSLELHLRCLVLPIAGMFLVIGAGCIVYLFYYLIYYFCTPEIFLPAIL